MQIRIEGVTKRYQRQPVLDGVSYVLEPGRIIAALGLNGAGKTTLLHCLAGWVALDGGQILYDGERLTHDRVELRKRFCFLPDFPMFFAGMTLLEHCGMALRLYEKSGSGIEERVMELLRAFEMMPYAEAALGTLSRGQLYKAGLVTLMAVQPELWLLDEPMASGMDALGLREFRKRAQDAANAGATIVYTTQILPVAEQFSDEVLVLHNGQIAASGPVKTLPQGGELENLFAALREQES